MWGKGRYRVVVEFQLMLLSIQCFDRSIILLYYMY